MHGLENKFQWESSVYKIVLTVEISSFNTFDYKILPEDSYDQIDPEHMDGSPISWNMKRILHTRNIIFFP